MKSSHHPFTMCHPDDLLELQRAIKNGTPIDMNTRGLHFDLTLNGVELGGGSLRVHDAGKLGIILYSLYNVFSLYNHNLYLINLYIINLYLKTTFI